MGGLGLELRHLFAASYDIASQAGQNSPQANRNCPSAPNKQSVTAWIMMSHHMINRREKKAKKKPVMQRFGYFSDTHTHTQTSTNVRTAPFLRWLTCTLMTIHLAGLSNCLSHIQHQHYSIHWTLLNWYTSVSAAFSKKKKKKIRTALKYHLNRLFLRPALFNIHVIVVTKMTPIGLVL